MKEDDLNLRKRCEADLYAFIKYVHPHRVLGACHEEVISWWNKEDSLSHQLLLFPRDHQKSALVAYRVVWELTKNPALRILYVSATSNLATKQLKFMKDILTCDRYTKLWPNMVNKEDSKREKWTENEISVDHPARAKETVRDPSIFTAGLTTTIVGLHCDIAVLDDVVIGENAETKDGREKVSTQASYLASIAGTDSRFWVVGTRYHPLDLYNDYLSMVYETYDEMGNVIDTHPLFEVYERPVESTGDGSGEFLWPRTQREDGKWFGFNRDILSKKKAQYQDTTKFRSQYYNSPNDMANASIKEEYFQYYKRDSVIKDADKWVLNGRRLNVFASVDFAFSLAKKSDYSCICVIGVDSANNVYVLDIERFKTNKISDYFDKILKLHSKWQFRKLRAEVTVAQEVIVKSLKNDYIRPHGLLLTVDEYRPMRSEGSKLERIESTLQPKYANGQMWHYKGGNCELLEQELVYSKPPHDDIKDALASAVDMAVAPTESRSTYRTSNHRQSNVTPHSRFGGFA